MDDNKTLTLPSNERIKVLAHMRLSKLPARGSTSSHVSNPHVCRYRTLLTRVLVRVSVSSL